MKRWALLTVALYLAALLVVLIPVIHSLVGEWVGLTLDALVWKTSSYFVAVMVAGQVLLLFVPARISKERPRARRSLLIPAITSAFMLSALIACAFASINVAIWGDYSKLFPNLNEIKDIMIWIAIICLIWLAWAVVFYRFSINTDSKHFIERLMRWLLAGSILELLVAVPSHVIVRQRGDCCAPLFTMFGITTGIAVMLLSFGPGVFFLFVRRFKQLRRDSLRDAPAIP